MTTHSASAEDAIQIYMLTKAYLHDVKFDINGATDAMRVREMSPAVYYIWHRDHVAKHGGPIVPLAICTYNMVVQTWRVELITGEKLTLQDKGDSWGIVKKEVQPVAGKVAKKVRLDEARRREQA